MAGRPHPQGLSLGGLSSQRSGPELLHSWMAGFHEGWPRSLPLVKPQWARALPSLYSCHNC